MHSPRQNAHANIGRYDRLATLLQFVLGGLAVALFIRAIYAVQAHDIAALLATVVPFAAACSSLLVAVVASRLLMFNFYAREDDRVHDAARLLNHAIVCVTDLRAHAQYAVSTITDAKRPLVALLHSVEVVERRYNVLLDRELYAVLPADAMDSILNLAGPIAGLAIIARSIDLVLSNSAAKLLPAAVPAQEPTAAAGQALLTDLAKLEEQLRRARALVA